MTSPKGEKKMARKTRKTTTASGGAVKLSDPRKSLSTADLAGVTGGVGAPAGPKGLAPRATLNETFYASNGPIPDMKITQSNTNVNIRYEYSPSNHALDRNVSMKSLTVSGNNDRVKII